MNHREKIEKAVRTLEAQRDRLGDAVIDITTAALREMLADPTALGEATGPQPQPATSPETAVILTAHVAGSEQMMVAGPADIVLVHDLWQRLEGAISQEGGRIVAHRAAVLTAVFGPHRDDREDPVRAVRAALAMQAIFRTFVAETVELSQGVTADLPDDPSLTEFPAQLRIGLDAGPVLKQGSANDQQTTDNMVRHLEQPEAPSGIFISQTIYDRVAHRLEVELLPPDENQDHPDDTPVYRLLGLRPRLFTLSEWDVAGVETALVGRDEALNELCRLLAQARSGAGQMVTIVGEGGLGKSRLAFELGQWVRQQGEEMLLLRAKAEQGIRPFPYALARDLLTTTLDIQDDEPVALVVEKLVAILRRLQVDEPDLRRQAHLLGQLVGLGVVDEAAGDIDLRADDGKARSLREQALAAWSHLVQQTMKRRQATLIFLEDLHLADVESLQLMAHVSQILTQAPVLLVCLTRPTLYDRWPHWPQIDQTHSLAIPHTRLDLDPLPDAACRQLVQNILRRVPQLPESLVALIVAKAEGNPFYVEELIKTLIDDGIILASGDEWRLQVQEIPRLRIPATLTEVLQARLNRLSQLERVTLQQASVMGHTFWETAVVAMSAAGNQVHALDEIQAALQALETRGLIFRQTASMFTGTAAYMFKHNLLQQVTYESILLRQRPLYHKLVADWLSAQSGERVAEYASKIAAHYELAGEAVLAAGLYELAGRQAQDMSNLEGAIDNYRKTLALLMDKPKHSLWLLRLQEQIGPLLVRRLRLVEAAQVYMTMQYTADMDGELGLQAQAWLGLADTQREQGNYLAMLHAAQRAHKAARLVTAQVEEANALLLQSEAYTHLGQIGLAQERAQEALTTSSQMSLLREQSLALGLLCQISGSQEEAEPPEPFRRQLEQLAASLDSSMSAHKMMALYHVVLAGVYQASGEWSPARSSLETALALYQELDNQLALAHTQAALGRLALRQGKADVAAAHLRQATLLAERIGDEYGRIRYQLYLTQALLALAQLDEAQDGLEWLLARTNNFHLMVDWWGQLNAYELLVQLYLARQEPELALNAARQAYAVAQKRDRQRDKAITWRLLAQALRALRPQTTTVIIDAQRYDVTGCFARSWQHFESANAQVPGHRRRALQTLRAWQTHEADQMPPEDLEDAFAEREATLLAAPTWDELYLPRY
jgi:predicted ATPase